MTRTKIEWATHTTNPLRARKLEAVTGQQALKILATGHYCEKVSEECRNCYASKWQPRFGMPEFAEHRRLGRVQAPVRQDRSRLLDGRTWDELLEVKS